MAEDNHYNNTQFGTRQTDRLPDALKDGYFRLDERGFDDLVNQVSRYARRVIFYDDNGATSTWQDFFDTDLETLKSQMEDGSVDPHMALMLSFLKLFGKEQEQLNALPQRQIEFYYRDILGITPHKGTYGTVPIFFELAKNTQSVFVPKGTMFSAGKDENSQPIYFSSVNDVTINRASVDRAFKKTYNRDNRIEIDAVSFMSQGKDPSDHVFYFELKGFDNLDGSIKFLTGGLADCNNIVAEYTTANGWHKLEGSNWSIPAENPRFAPYNRKTHGGSLNGSCPMLRLTCPKISDVSFVKNLKSLKVEISDCTGIILENPVGTVANRRGAQPFGPACNKGDSLIIKLPFVPDGDITVTNGTASNSCCVFKSSIAKALTDVIDSKFEKETLELKLTLKVDDYSQAKYIREFATQIAALVNNTNAGKPLVTNEQNNALMAPIVLEKPISLNYGFTYQLDEPVAVSSVLSSSVIRYYDRFKNDSLAEGNSELYLRIKGLDQPGVVSIYFLIDALTDMGGRALQWFYFNNTEWRAFDPLDIVTDTTNGLHNSGIVSLNIGNDSIHWVKAAFDRPFVSSAIIDIKTQVVDLEYDTSSPGAPQLGKAIPAGTITKSRYTIPGIKTVEQKYSGKEGEYDETEMQYICRVSELLRHKGRAWSSWDYERLVLEKFPQISSVQCIPAHNKKLKIAPGVVLLVIVPQATQESGPNPLTPMAGRPLIEEIERYLQSKCSNQVTVVVQNPIYDKVSVTCRVQLKKGFTDQKYYKSLLNDHLIAFFAPWTSGQNELTLEKRVLNETSLFASIQSLPFIHKINSMEVSIEGSDKRIEQGGDITPSDIGHILTSVPQHSIEIDTTAAL